MLVVTGGAGLALSVWIYVRQPFEIGDREYRVARIRPRSGSRTVTSALSKQGLVRSPLRFQLYLWLSGQSRAIRPGLYCVYRGQTPRDLVRMISRGATCPALLVRPGDNSFDLFRRLRRLDASRFASIDRLCRDRRFLRSLGVPLPESVPTKFVGRDLSWAPLCEGWWPPGEFLVKKSEDARALLRRLLRLSVSRFDALKRANSAAYSLMRRRFALDDLGLITLASLVEKEAVLDRERPIVASVFFNRLREKWRLDSDPSLVYHPRRIGGVPRPEHRRDRTNPYNTYTFKGLPLGPIAIPGRRSIEAVLRPAVTGYFYFVARGDGTAAHRFSKTSSEHNEAVRLLRENLRRRRGR